VKTPIGDLALSASERGLARIEFGPGRDRGDGSPAAERHLAAARAALLRYFAGDPRAFREIEIDLEPATPFRARIYAELRAIPFGETRSYAELAALAGRPRAARAVGTAMAENPLPIVLPCHRVLGAHGAIGGYGPGLAMKRWLLGHEGARDAST
jgi:methylated-DNA-[protein]-cysteine S-methyltransferase